MTKRQFVVLAFRLFALYLLFNLLSGLATIFKIASSPGAGVTLYLVAGFAIFIALAFITLLWRKSEWLMQKVFAIPILSDAMLEGGVAGTHVQSQEVTVVQTHIQEAPEMMDYYETPISMESIQVVAFSVLGLWVAMDSLPTVVRESYMFLLNPFPTGRDSMMWVVPYLLQLALGVWLFLRPWQFQGWIEKFKPQHDKDENMVKSN
jgi:hypothetical protein